MNQSSGLGLSADDVILSHRKYGRNEIESQVGRSVWRLLAEQFMSPLVLLLLAATALSAALGEWAESSAIAAILVLNAVVGFFQEFKAEKSVQALKQMTAPRATVLRDGKIVVIAASEVAHGDLLLLEAGDIVAADAKIIESANLQINEAILTGESQPALKSATPSLPERQQIAFMGTSITTGNARAEVIAVGMLTELGKIAGLLANTKSPPTPLQTQLKEVGKTLLKVCAGIFLLILILGWIHHRPWLDLVVFAISLSVAIVPEGMPALVTVALALGVRRMAAQNVLVRSLPSVETLGSVSVICTDKTGTLTTGKMRVTEMSGTDRDELIRNAVSCCDAELGENGESPRGDPTELAILIAAGELGIVKSEIESSNPRIATQPFDATRKRMSIARADNEIYVKGAFETVIPLCDDLQDRAAIEAKSEGMTSQGMRVLAIATGMGVAEKNLKYSGLIGISDPPREEAKQAIHDARTAGIEVVMITGDHPTTAAVIAREIGLLLPGENLGERVHARTTPKEKLEIIRGWKRKGAIVAMTGDGVNDAPALQEAHIGIAMGKEGTEVTRQAADLILADDNFASLISAVKEGRSIYQNIRKATVFLLTGNFGELFTVLGASLIGLPLLFSAPHLLWINLVTDSLPALALIADPTPKGIMSVPPRPSTEPLLGKPEWTWIISVGALEGSLVLALFIWTLKHEGVEQARNLAFTTLVLSQLWRSFSARSRTRLFFQVGFRNNLWLLGVVFATASLQIGMHFNHIAQKAFGLKPLTLPDLVTIFGFSIVTAILIELRKLIFSFRR